MFRDLFLMEDDIATIMTNLVMHGNVLPTGAPSSQLIAYWAYQDMFSEINEYAIENNYKFSLYVDDICYKYKCINHPNLRFFYCFSLSFYFPALIYCFSFARIAAKKDAMDPANNTAIINTATGASLIYTHRS